MKRIIVVAGLLVVAATYAACEGFGEPNFFFPPANFGMLLPEDTQVSEEEGLTVYFSEKEALGVLVSEAEKPFKDADLLDAKKLTAALKELGAYDIKLGASVTEGDLVWGSAKVKMKWDDGSVDEGYMLLLNSVAAKGTTFIVGIFKPKIEDSEEDAAWLALETLTFASAP